MKSNPNSKDPSKQYFELVGEFISLYSLFSKKKKLRAIEFFKSKLNEGNFEIEELASGYIFLGYNYEEIKEYENAAFYFDKGFSLGNHILFPYDADLKTVLKTFLKANRTDLYDYWRSNFLNRSHYDKKFSKLK